MTLPPMLLRGILLATLRPQQAKSRFFQSVFYNEAGDIVNYDPNPQVASAPACT